MSDDISWGARAPWPLLIIRWVDSAAPENGWVSVARWESKSVECVSVGYLIEDHADRMTIAAHIAHPNDEAQSQAAGVMVIPKRSVISSLDLRTSSSLADAAQARFSDHQEFAPTSSAASEAFSDCPDFVQPP